MGRALGFVPFVAVMVSVPSVALAHVSNEDAIDGAEAAQPEAEDEVEQEDVDDYCGGEPSAIDEVWSLIDAGEVRQAHGELVALLRRGEVTTWQRPTALALLAETQLRLGHHGQAVRNYSLALRLVDDASFEGWRVGLAASLLRSGLKHSARREAEHFVDASCGQATQDSVACYGGQIILSLTSEDDIERRTARESAEELRARDPSMDGSFASMHTLLEPGSEPTRI